MLTPADIQQIVFQALDGINEERSSDERFTVGPDTLLFGADAPLDSLALVSVIVDVEEGVSAAAGRAVMLTDDRAMNRDVSPFTDVQAITAYVVELLAEPA